MATDRNGVMRHVFVETNWVIDFAAPVSHRLPEAVALLDLARAGDITLHVPAVCLLEARRKITRRDPRGEADPIRRFLAWATPAGAVSAEEAHCARLVLDKYESRVRLELQSLSECLDALRTTGGVEVYGMTDTMLARACELSAVVELEPFDLAILSAVLIRAADLAAAGEGDSVFCTTDGDLRKSALCDLYNAASLSVRRDFRIDP